MLLYSHNDQWTDCEYTAGAANCKHCSVLQGFRLQDPEVDDVVRAARDLEAGCIEPDVELTAEDNVELLLRATRLLQLGLEVQFAEAENLVLENNNLRDDMRVRLSATTTRCRLCSCHMLPRSWQ